MSHEGKQKQKVLRVLQKLTFLQQQPESQVAYLDALDSALNNTLGEGERTLFGLLFLG